MSRVVGKGESGLRNKTPNLHARMKRSLVCKKKERRGTHR